MFNCFLLVVHPYIKTTVCLFERLPVCQSVPTVLGLLDKLGFHVQERLLIIAGWALPFVESMPRVLPTKQAQKCINCPKWSLAHPWAH